MIPSPRTWIEISKTALEHNLSQYKKIVGEGLLGAVVKSNAYGHGMIGVASVCEESTHADWLCVAMFSEALKLREHGVKKPILVLSFIDQEIDQLPEQVYFPVYDLDGAHQLSEVAKRLKKVIQVHLKVDTGLARLGVFPEHAVEVAQQIMALKGIRLAGIFSHFAESDAQNAKYTSYQAEQFMKVADYFTQHKIKIPFWHTANSAGVCGYDHAGANLFRVGAGLYGLWSSSHAKKMAQEKYPDFNLKTVLTWKTRVLCVKAVPRDQYVGYSRTFKTSRQTRLAILPVGYYDGYDFRLFNKANVFINDRYVPVVGRISMNMVAVDVTDVPGAAKGQEVILMGDYDGIRPGDLANLASEIPNIREITTKINPTIVRILV